MAFEESFIGSWDSVIFKLNIFDNEKTDFETIMNLVRMFDTEVDEAAIEIIYNEWLTGDNAHQNYEVGNHQIDTYSEDASMGNAFIVRFTYPLEMFQNGDYLNLIETKYDANRSLPNIYTEEETDEAERMGAQSI